MDKKIRILHVISDTNIGGAGKLLLNLSKCIDKNKFELVFAVPQGSKLKIELKKEGRVYSFLGKGDKSADILAVPSICRIIKGVRPNIVHTHSSISGRIAAIISGIKKEKIVYTKHCVFDVPTRYTFKMCRKIYRIIDNILSGSVIAVAESAKSELVKRGVASNKISVIINGSIPFKKYSDNEILKIKREIGITENDFVVGIVARLEEYKGHKTFLKAAELAGMDNESIKFIIVGDGSCKEELMAYTAEMGISDRVVFTGFVNNVEKYMNIFNLNINCSTGTETSCLSISEGLSIGIPAIVTDFGGNPNMVINGVSGFVFNRNDAKQLYKIIKNLKNAPEIMKKIKLNAQKDYKHRFNALNMAREYERFYENLISK